MKIAILLALAVSACTSFEPNAYLGSITQNDLETKMRGPKGDKGDIGKDGKDGANGLNGEKGDKGIKGDKGDVGPTGPQGERGPAGWQGPIGPAGPQGAVGAPGPVGPKGADGARGAQGPQGEVGPKGEKGDTCYTSYRASGTFISEINNDTCDDYTYRCGSFITQPCPAKKVNTKSYENKQIFISIPALTEQVWRDYTVLIYLRSTGNLIWELNSIKSATIYELGTKIGDCNTIANNNPLPLPYYSKTYSYTQISNDSQTSLSTYAEGAITFTAKPQIGGVLVSSYSGGKFFPTTQIEVKVIIVG